MPAKPRDITSRSKIAGKSGTQVNEFEAASTDLFTDPDDAAELVREGIASYERGEYIELNGDDELRAYFEGIKERGRLALDAELSRREKACK